MNQYIKNKTAHRKLKNMLAEILRLKSIDQNSTSNAMIGGAKTYTITVSQPWYDFIASGRKTVEGRLNRGIFRKIMPDDIIMWKNNESIFETIVTHIKSYDSFKEMIEDQKLENVLPEIATIGEGEAIYFKYYSKEDEAEHGVVAIGLKRKNVEELNNSGDESSDKSSDESSDDSI